MHNDHLGRAERITNQNKSTVWYAHNFSFDRVVKVNHIGGYNLDFPGQYWDSEKGSYYNYFRDYEPELGRYIQSDPIGLTGGINTYAYVGGNPIMFTDQFGLAPDVNLVPITQNRGKYWMTMNKHVDNSDLNFSVGAHGNPKGVVNQLGRILTPMKLLSIMKDGGYDGKQPIQLYACETGKGGDNSFAQKLANLTGQPVTAPTNLFTIPPDGNHFVDNGGSWVTFYPMSGGN